MGPPEPVRRVARDERGAISISDLLLIAAVLALLWAVFGASTGDPDKFGRVPVPSNTLVELPTEEADIFWVVPVPASGPSPAPPSDLRILVSDPGTREPVDVNSKSDEAREHEGEAFTPVARVDAPGAGQYQLIVTSSEAIRRPAGMLAIGESPVGAIGDRFLRIGDLITGPFGIAAGVLLLAALLTPRVQRAVRRARSG